MPAENSGQFLEFKFITAGGLEDGRMQLFGIDTYGHIFSRWKLTPDPNSGWSGWSNFPMPFYPVTSICVGYLSDKRMQLFATAEGRMYSCWKTTTDPNASWTSWSDFTYSILTHLPSG
jgi:hypothetical protein